MAEDKGKTDIANDQEVDIDEIDLGILIVAKNPKALESTSSFLTRRGWPTTVLASVSRAIEHINKFRPDFVLLSLNHKAQGMERLPELITKTFRGTCIFFVEGQDTTSANRLAKFKAQYKVPGQASGPNVQRTIRKILAERFNIKEDERAEGQGTTAAATDDKITIKGGKVEDGAANMVKGSAQSETEKEVIKTDKYTITKTTRRSLKELANEPVAEVKSLTPEQESLHQTVEVALQGVCTPAELHTELERTKRVAVIPVDSTTTPGYLVVASPMNPKTGEKFFASLQTALAKLMTNGPVKGTLESGLWVNVPDVEFKSWSQTSATFRVILNHEGVEVGVAFFATDRALPKVQEVLDEGMLALQIDNVPTEQPINFKAYLHMRRNNKYYLYLRNGRTLQPEQKRRLKNRNVNSLFMKDVDRENIRAFLASVFLTSTMKNEDPDEGAA